MASSSTDTTPTTSNPITMLAFTTRKPGLTFAEFRSYYEDKHIPWVTSLILSGPNAPLSYTRSYIDRGADPGTTADTTKSFPMGGAQSWDYDCVVRNVFRDEKHRDDCLAEYMKHFKEIREDEERFLDCDKGRVVFITEVCGK